jgi:hypothetical protein
MRQQLAAMLDSEKNRCGLYSGVKAEVAVILSAFRVAATTRSGTIVGTTQLS